MLARTNAATRAANDVFAEAMRNLSARVASRGFGADGLSRDQGMLVCLAGAGSECCAFFGRYLMKRGEVRWAVRSCKKRTVGV
jgi:hypothetical protein